MFRFESLDVWTRSIEFADSIYEATREFPDNEKYGLVSQLRRAAVSISSNLAEGSGRTSNKEQIRFVEFAYGSLMEVVSQIHISQRQSFITTDDARGIYSQAEEVARMLSGYKAFLEKKR